MPHFNWAQQLSCHFKRVLPQWMHVIHLLKVSLTANEKWIRVLNFSILSTHTHTQDGVTVRGCQASASTCSGPECTSCVGEKCNGQIFPVNRLACHQCSGTACLTPASASIYTCENYSATDSCYSVFSMGKFV